MINGTKLPCLRCISALRSEPPTRPDCCRQRCHGLSLSLLRVLLATHVQGILMKLLLFLMIVLIVFLTHRSPEKAAPVIASSPSHEDRASSPSHEDRTLQKDRRACFGDEGCVAERQAARAVQQLNETRRIFERENQ
jgi:hypothetical protein